MRNERHEMESLAAELGARTLEWNELDFVGWREFRRMAPAVVGLEMSRLDRVIAEHEPGSEAYNTLVRARYELRQFAEGLAGAERRDLHGRARHLDNALLAIGLLSKSSVALEYTARRLQYIHHRLRLVY